MLVSYKLHDMYRLLCYLQLAHCFIQYRKHLILLTYCPLLHLLDVPEPWHYIQLRCVHTHHESSSTCLSCFGENWHRQESYVVVVVNLFLHHNCCYWCPVLLETVAFVGVTSTFQLEEGQCALHWLDDEFVVSLH